MDLSYDIWTGESISTIFQTIAEFRLQVLQDNHYVEPILSDEINKVQHYLDDQAMVVVANDCGKFVGYMALVDISENHPNALSVSYYNSDMKVSEGPIVHPYYRGAGVGQTLIRESINECEILGIESLVIDPRLSDNNQMDKNICTLTGFNLIGNGDQAIWLKDLNS